MRSFRVQPGRVVIPPRALVTGPGATHMRFHPGDVLMVATVDRFIRGRIAAGDLVEVAAPPAAPSPRPAPPKEI